MSQPHVLGLRKRTVSLTLACFILATWLGIAGPRPISAQTAAPIALEETGPLAAQRREELYRTLQRHAEVLETQATIVKTVAKLIGPTVVHIEAEVRPRGGRIYGRHRIEEAGSGVIIQLKDGYYVLTNGHVVRNSSPGQIRITLADGRTIHPLLIREDKETDVAVMSVSASGLVAARVGDSDRMEIGDFVLAVGSPFGLSHSVTYGIISAKGRHDLELGSANVKFQDFIQTDAAINPGNSGGPLVNLRGEIIGINTAIASSSGGNEGIGFAIPINMFMSVGRQLIERGEVARAFLGVDLDRDYGPEMAAKIGLPRPVGARVKKLTAGAPAEAANLQVGDVILKLDNVQVEDDLHLINLVGLKEVGKTVSLVVLRDRKPITVKVRLADKSEFQIRRLAPRH